MTTKTESLERSSVQAKPQSARRSPLRAALLGVSGAGRVWLEAIVSDSAYELCALGDERANALDLPAGAGQARTYTDYRSLLVEAAHAGLDVLFVALEPFQALDFVELAASRRVSVLHKAPAARTVREARRLVERFDQAGVHLAVSRWWRFEPAFAALRDLGALIGHVYAADAEVAISDTPEGWRGDRVKAGGGALLHGAYDAIDLLVSLLGVPESVSAQCAMAIPPNAPMTYDTEDVAFVTLKFPQECVASVSARRGAAKPVRRITLWGTQGTVEITPKRMTVTRRDTGKSRIHRVRAAHELAPVLTALAAFLSGQPHSFDSMLQDHLTTLAVIEAAYLSARTGEREAPARLIEQV